MPSTALIEAACLAHDLGHPPFGHAGEQVLFAEMRDQGGFEGNAQTLRTMTRLEKFRERGHGINPTRRLILAVLKYPVPYSNFDVGSERFKYKPPKCYFDAERDVVEWALAGFSQSDQVALRAIDSRHRPTHRTLDASIMELADDIAYGIHDIEDIVARHLTTERQMTEELTKSFEVVSGSLMASGAELDARMVADGLFADSYSRKRTIGHLVSTFVTAVLITAHDEFDHPLLKFRATLPHKHKELLDQFKNMAFRLVIDRPRVQQLERRGMRVVREIFHSLSANPRQLIPSWDDHGNVEGRGRGVCDYVAGMTDSYAEKVYRRFFLPGVGSSSDEL
jgi:dGTPase